MRPKKLTVDYFPHDCNHKKTIFILENKFGNDGYAFWFKLLEILGNTDNHYIDYCKENSNDWEFLQAITHLDSNICNDILDLLAKLHAIDPFLWENRIVWSDKFISRISTVYANRRQEIPSKPSFYKQKPTGDIVSTKKTRQTKVKETKVKKKYIYKKEKKYDEKLKEFDKKVRDYVKEHPKYEPVLENFISYWSESNDNGKMRVEFEVVFEIGKRLGTFLKNDKKKHLGNNQKSIKEIEGY